jgi:hypothetical protein
MPARVGHLFGVGLYNVGDANRGFRLSPQLFTGTAQAPQARPGRQEPSPLPAETEG